MDLHSIWLDPTPLESDAVEGTVGGCMDIQSIKKACDRELRHPVTYQLDKTK